MYKKVNICFLLFVLFVLAGKSQNVESEIFNAEVEIRQMMDSLKMPLKDTVKKEINSKIAIILEEILKEKETFTYPFDSLMNMGKLYSPGKAFRLYNWNVPLNDGTHLYECFIQYYNKSKSEIYLTRMKDKSRQIVNPEMPGLNAENWFGALYYEIIEKKSGRNSDYVLLGINFNDRYSNYKIIEALNFSGRGKPVFNNAIFYFGKSRKKRVLFQYNEKAVMMLKYEEKVQTIIFDRLYPLEAKYKGDYRYYVPDVTNDGLVYKNGRWFYVPKIDPNNPKKNWTKKQLRTIEERKGINHD